MSFHSFPSAVFSLSRTLLPIAVILTTYLYLYPVFLGCVFPSVDRSLTTAFRDTVVQHTDSINVNPLGSRLSLAPFRLLVLADPQLEGDSSLPDPEDAFSAKLARHRARVLENASDLAQLPGVVVDIMKELVCEDIPGALQAARKRLDLFGNDYYLAHIFRTLHWWTKPTHVTVLGDLIGSQWVDDEEFEWRGWRYWNRVFRHGARVENSVMHLTQQDEAQRLQMDDPRWKHTIVNIAGNHDIGYAGDISKRRIERFEEKYGKVNWDVRFEYPGTRSPMNQTKPTLHLVILNSMLLDTPAMDEELQGQTYEYINQLIQHRLQPVEDRTDFTLLLTHVPLHKKQGTCVDAPFFDFHDNDEDCDGECKPHGLKEQNHLSKHASQPGMMQAIFGMSGDLEAAAHGKGRPGLILTGHDHEGCDVWHYVPINSTFAGSEVEDEEDKETVWGVSRWRQADPSIAHTGIREVTLRSMMGEFGGNAGLLSMWFDFELGEWQYDMQMCKLGVQHIWWAVHVVDAIALALLILSALLKMQQLLGKNNSQISKNKSMKVD